MASVLLSTSTFYIVIIWIYVLSLHWCTSSGWLLVWWVKVNNTQSILARDNIRWVLIASNEDVPIATSYTLLNRMVVWIRALPKMVTWAFFLFFPSQRVCEDAEEISSDLLGSFQWRWQCPGLYPHLSHCAVPPSASTSVLEFSFRSRNLALPNAVVCASLTIKLHKRLF